MQQQQNTFLAFSLSHLLSANRTTTSLCTLFLSPSMAIFWKGKRKRVSKRESNSSSSSSTERKSCNVPTRPVLFLFLSAVAAVSNTAKCRRRLSQPKCSKRGLAELFQRAIPLLLLLLSYLLLLISHQANTYATNTQTLSLSLSTDQDDDEQNFPAI